MPAHPATQNGLTHQNRWWALAVLSFGLFMASLDNTILNVALPTLARELHASTDELQWTVDAYTVVMASLLMLGGSIADRFGRRRVFVTGLSIFSFASLLCSLAPSVNALIAARILQAVGASMMNPVAMSIITNAFTDPRERAQAVAQGARQCGGGGAEPEAPARHARAVRAGLGAEPEHVLQGNDGEAGDGLVSESDHVPVDLVAGGAEVRERARPLVVDTGVFETLRTQAHAEERRRARRQRGDDPTDPFHPATLHPRIAV